MTASAAFANHGQAVQRTAGCDLTFTTRPANTLCLALCFAPPHSTPRHRTPSHPISIPSHLIPSYPTKGVDALDSNQDPTICKLAPMDLLRAEAEGHATFARWLPP